MTSAYIVHIEDNGMEPDQLAEVITQALLREGIEVTKINPWDSPGQTTSDPIAALDAAFRP